MNRYIVRMTHACVLASLLLAGSLAHAADPATADWSALQGTWMVAAAEQGGKPFDVIKGGKLVITEHRFDLVTASGNKLSGEIVIDPAVNPKHLDFRLAGGANWLAIYSLNGNSLRLNYVEAEDGAPRPTRFVTAASEPGTVIALKRDAP